MPYTGDITQVPPGNSGRGFPYNWDLMIDFANLTKEVPGSARWWLAKGIAAISQKSGVYKTKHMYVNGPHPYPNGDKRYVRALEDLQRKTQTNYISLVVNSPIQRMNVQGFRFGDTQADEDAKKAWMANDMDVQMELFLKDAATYGEAYLLVGDIDPETGLPTITTECPTVAHVFQDPQNPTKSLCGVRVWKDVFEDRVIAVVYLPEVTMAFVGPANKGKADLIANPDSYDFVSAEVNRVGVVQLIRAEWRPDNKGEADDLFPIQDRINHTVLDRLLISKNQAYNQKWATGVNLERGKKRRDSTPPFNPGSDTLFLVPDENAKFGQFEAADIKQLLEAIRDDVVDMASLSQTPPYYLMGKMSNVGGDTLTQASAGFVAKIKSRSRSVGWALEKTMRVVFLYAGLEAKAKEVDAEVIWADPEVRNRGELADAAVKESQVFATCPPFAIPVVAARMGLDPDQIQNLVEAAEKWQKEQQAREDDLMKQETNAALAVAKEGGKAKAPTATKPKGSGSPAKS